jgi:hypothetical protein
MGRLPSRLTEPGLPQLRRHSRNYGGTAATTAAQLPPWQTQLQLRRHSRNYGGTAATTAAQPPLRRYGHNYGGTAETTAAGAAGVTIG